MRATIIAFAALGLAVPVSAFSSALPSAHGTSLRLRAGAAPTPQGAYDKAVALGEKKALLSPDKIFTLGIVSGAHIGLGAFLAIAGGGSVPQMAAQNPGAQRILMGAFGLPMGLFMTLVGGGELVTGNFAVITAALLDKKASLQNLVKNWGCAFAGNLVGSLLLVSLAYTAGTLSGAAAAAPMGLAVKKCSLTFAEALTRGILCNWLVCMAVWAATCAEDLASKALAIFLPISGFVALGLEHSVANMFIVPYGIACGADLTMKTFFASNLLPVTLGNMIGGALAVATPYWYSFGKKE